MSIDDSYILGKTLADFDTDDMTQDQIDETMEDYLRIHDIAELLEAIEDPEVGKFDILFLINSAEELHPNYWYYVLYKIIKVYRLNTLKLFLDDEMQKAKVDTIIKLLKYLRVELPDIKVDILPERIPEKRSELVKFFEDHDAPEILIFSVKTIDKEDYTRFKKVLLSMI